MRPKVLRISVLVAVALVALLLVVLRWPTAPKSTVKAYFANVGGLREGAQVRIAGVDIGSVRSIRVRPELGTEPVEVVMALNPSYEIKIPNDSTVLLRTAGVLGETYAEIDTAAASGPPIGANAVLKARTTNEMTMQQFIERVSKILEKKDCDCAVQTERAEGNAPPARRPSGKPTR